MASLRDIRLKIKSIKSIQQVTKAMKMVAAARLRRSQARILAARPFANKMEEMVLRLLEGTNPEEMHPLFAKKEGKKRVLLLVTSDKGSCGAFNTNLIREALRCLKQYGSANVQLYIVGRKGRDYFTRTGYFVSKEYVHISNTLSFAHAELITADLLTAYSAPSVIAVDMIYNEFKSVVQQKLVVKSLLPLIADVEAKPVSESDVEFIYEPSEVPLLQALIPRFLKAQVFRVLLESNAAELGARMTAMDNATRNASDLMNSLTLTMNRTRQASITKEILEVVSGAEALK